MDKKPQTIEVLLKEKRTFNPKKDFIEKANIKSRAIYQKAKKDNEKFWETFANELHWFRKWKKTLSWKPPFAQWFIGGKTNVSYNCIDRHIHTSRELLWGYSWTRRHVIKATLISILPGIMPSRRQSQEAKGHLEWED